MITKITITINTEDWQNVPVQATELDIKTKTKGDEVRLIEFISILNQAIQMAINESEK